MFNANRVNAKTINNLREFGTSIKNKTFNNIEVLRSSFDTCRFRNIQAMELMFDWDSFNDCVIIDCFFQECYFYRCSFHLSHIVKTIFRGVTFEICNFADSWFGDIGESFFIGCRFVDCIFSNDSSIEMFQECEFVRPQKLPYMSMACPDEGEFIGYKKAYANGKFVIVTLRIPADAKRSSAFGRKCRCSKAEVIAIESVDNPELSINTAFSCYSGSENEIAYTVGETVYPDQFDENRWLECSSGIHFFMNKEEAIRY